MFTPTLRCECAQPGLIDTMRKWSIGWLIYYHQSVACEVMAVTSESLMVCSDFYCFA